MPYHKLNTFHAVMWHIKRPWLPTTLTTAARASFFEHSLLPELGLPLPMNVKNRGNFRPQYNCFNLDNDFCLGFAPLQINHYLPGLRNTSNAVAAFLRDGNRRAIEMPQSRYARAIKWQRYPARAFAYMFCRQCPHHLADRPTRTVRAHKIAAHILV